MQDLTTLSYEEVCIFVRRLCMRIAQMEDGWDTIHQIDIENALNLLLDISEDGTYCYFML